MVSFEEYLELYQVDDQGNVTRGGRKLKWRDYGGYPFVRFWKNGISQDFSVHRLVAMLHINNPDNLPVVNHKNGNTWAPRKENLEWCTYAYNSQHSYDELGRVACNGEENGKSKLTEESVREIRELISDGVLRQRQIAEKYGVDQTVISKIKAGKLWGWLE